MLLKSILSATIAATLLMGCGKTGYVEETATNALRKKVTGLGGCEIKNFKMKSFEHGTISKTNITDHSDNPLPAVIASAEYDCHYSLYNSTEHETAWIVLAVDEKNGLARCMPNEISESMVRRTAENCNFVPKDSPKNNKVNEVKQEKTAAQSTPKPAVEAPTPTPAAVEQQQPVFYKIDQALTVNLGTNNYLQIGNFTIMCKSSRICDKIEPFKPLILDKIQLTMSSQSFEKLSAPNAGPAFRKELTQTVATVLGLNPDTTDIEVLLPSSYIMQ